MNGNGSIANLWSRVPGSTAFACRCAVAALVFLVYAAAAQESRQPHPANTPPAPAAAQQKQEGFFETFGRWWNDSIANMNSTMQGARGTLDNFNREAGIAAKSTADAARDAADAMVRLPNTRIVSGHEICALAPNGAPDCVAAANAVCRAKGFSSGKSVDMTTAEKCPARVWLSGRQAGECTTETFVSRAICQ